MKKRVLSIVLAGVLAVASLAGCGGSAGAGSAQETKGSGNWLDGQRFSGGVSEDEIASWIDGLY